MLVELGYEWIKGSNGANAWELGSLLVLRTPYICNNGVSPIRNVESQALAQPKADSELLEDSARHFLTITGILCTLSIEMCFILMFVPTPFVRQAWVVGSQVP